MYFGYIALNVVLVEKRVAVIMGAIFVDTVNRKTYPMKTNNAKDAKMPRLDYPLPTLWDLTQWLAGHLNNGTAKDWMRPLYDSPHKENAFNLALKLSNLPHAFVPVTGLSDDELGEFNGWVTGIANAFIQPYCNAMEGKPSSPIHLSCSSGDLNNITITTKNAVSPTNRYGENEDGDKETVILSVKACNIN